jgi:hypothetical protein
MGQQNVENASMLLTISAQSKIINFTIYTASTMMKIAPPKYQMDFKYSQRFSSSYSMYWRFNWDTKLLLTRRGGKLASP